MLYYNKSEIMSVDKTKILDALKLIKEAFAKKTEKFTDQKLQDGTTIIRYDAEELAIGVPILVVTDQGAIAIPDGDYTTDMGDMFTTVGGVVTAATLAPEPIEPVEAAPSTAPSPSPAQPMTEARAKSIVESIIKESRFASADRVNEVENTITDLKGEFGKAEWKKAFIELQAAHEALAEQFKKALDLIEQIADLPSATPSEPTKKSAFDLRAHKKAFKADLEKLINQ